VHEAEEGQDSAGEREGGSHVLRLEGFLARNGTPRMRLDPETDPEAKALIDRFHVDPGQLPIVICPGGQVLRNPSEDQLARCIGLVGPIDPEHLYDIAIVGAGPATGLATSPRRPVRRVCLWPQNPVSWETETPLAETRFEWATTRYYSAMRLIALIASCRRRSGSRSPFIAAAMMRFAMISRIVGD
jgi:hypothetical protein